MSRDCKLEVSKLFKDISAEDVDKLHKGMSTQIEEAIAKGFTPDQAVAHVLKKQKANIQVAANTRSITVQKTKAATEYLLDPQFKGDARKALSSLVEPLSGREAGGLTYTGRLGNVHGEAGAVLDDGFSILLSGLKDDLKVHHVGTHDLDMWKLWYKEPIQATKAVSRGYNAFKKTQDFMFEELKAAGFNVHYLDNRVIATIHPKEALMQMKEPAWVAFADRHFERTPNLSPTERTTMFQDIYNKRTSPFSLNPEVGAAHGLEASRQLKFKDATSAMEYHNVMSGGETLLGAVGREVKSRSYKIGAARVLGPEYEKTFKNLSEMAYSEMIATGKIADSVAKTKIEKINKTFRVATGERGRGDNWLAAMGRTVGQVTDLALLPTALPSTLSDFAITAAKMSQMTDNNYYKELYRAVEGSIAGVKRSKRRERAINLRMLCEQEISGFHANRYGEVAQDGVVRNWLDPVHQKGMLLTGLPDQSHIARLSTANKLNNMVGGYSSKFVELPDEWQRTLMKVGIEANEWSIIKKAVTKLDDGSTGVDLDKIAKLDDSLFTAKGISVDEQKRTILRRYQNFLKWSAEQTSPTGVPSITHHLLADRNTVMGQAHISFAKFKTFSFAMEKVMSEIITSPTQSGFGKTKLIASQISAMMTLGLASQALSDILRGRDLRSLSDPKTYVGGILKSGIIGFWFDPLMTSYAKLEGMLAGPTVSLISEGLDVAQTALTGEGRRALLKGFKWGTKVAPVPLGPLTPFVKEGVLRGLEELGGVSRPGSQKRFKYIYMIRQTTMLKVL